MELNFRLNMKYTNTLILIFITRSLKRETIHITVMIQARLPNNKKDIPNPAKNIHLNDNNTKDNPTPTTIGTTLFGILSQTFIMFSAVSSCCLNEQAHSGM